MIFDELLYFGIVGALLFVGYFLYLEHTASDEYKKKYPWKFDFIIIYMVVAPFVGGGLGALIYYLFHLLIAS